MLTVNGRPAALRCEPDTPLLYVLRNDLGLSGTRFGCGMGVCGACTVLVDGRAVQSCTLPVGSVGRAAVRTVEGLAGAGDGRPHPLQRAFLAEQAAQCGYCVPGILMTATALLERGGRPSEADVRAALDGNLCRCGAHNRIVRAVLAAAGQDPVPAAAGQDPAPAAAAEPA